MAVIKIYNKERNTTYVYESLSYWDKEKKQPRSKRKLIGKIDPVSGEIVPTGKRGRHKSEVSHSDTKTSDDLLKAKDLEILQLKQQLEALKQENQKYRKMISQLGDILDRVR